jgi:phosphate transport system protein
MHASVQVNVCGIAISSMGGRPAQCIESLVAARVIFTSSAYTKLLRQADDRLGIEKIGNAKLTELAAVTGENMPDKHLATQFDADLALLSTRLLEMGGLVESQIVHAIEALNAFEPNLVELVLEGERRLNVMEIELDEEITNVIARRQPAARDLRLLMAASKCVTNLERAGDEARKIVKRTRRIASAASSPNVNIAEIKVSGEIALDMVRRALDAYARMDATEADQIIRDDESIDGEFRAFVRKLVTYMMEDPRTIITGLDYLFIAKAIERIGDHATNIAESVVYAVRGVDIRHDNRKQHERNVLPR